MYFRNSQEIQNLSSYVCVTYDTNKPQSDSEFLQAERRVRIVCSIKKNFKLS